MAYLSLTRFAGNPDALLATYTRLEPTMSAVGRDHSLLVHAAARTDAGLLIINLWPSPDGSRTASQDPRRLAALRGSGLTPSRSSVSTTTSTTTPCSPESLRGGRQARRGARWRPANFRHRARRALKRRPRRARSRGMARPDSSRQRAADSASSTTVRVVTRPAIAIRTLALLPSFRAAALV